jgi:hypothetical protein
MTWLDALTFSTVIVHTKNGMSFKGIKQTVYDDCLMLRDARVLEDEGMSRVLNGEVAIPRENVDFMQLMPPGDS